MALLSGLNEKKDFPGGSVVKHLAGNVQVMGLFPRSGGSPEKGMATHSSILAWKIHGQRSLAGYKSMMSQKSRTRLIN